MFEEKKVELILIVLRSVGFSLRKDDPLALKELILQLQKKANEASSLQKKLVLVNVLFEFIKKLFETIFVS